MPVKKVRSRRFKSGWGYQVTINRKGLRIKQTFETLALANDIHDALVGDRVRRRHALPLDSHVTLHELIERHLEQLGRKGRDVVRATTVLERFERLAGGDRMVESITTADMTAYASARLDDTVQGHDDLHISHKTINREMNEIKGCLTAAKTYYRTLDGWQSPKGAWLEEPSDGRRQTWAPEMIAAVMRELTGPRRKGEKAGHVAGRKAVADMFVIALQTGMRAGEVRRLGKRDVDFKTRIIRVVSKKGLSVSRSALTREIPMTDIVYGILQKRAGNGSAWFFPGEDGKAPLSSYHKTFIHACERASVPYGMRGGLIFNDARRTAENLMLESGYHARIVGDILGHSAETMARHYARSTKESRREAVGALANFGRNLVAQGPNGQDNQGSQKRLRPAKKRKTPKKAA